LEAKLESLRLELAKFRASTGDKLLVRLSDLESSVKSMESSGSSDALKGIGLQLRTLLITEIYPAICDLWLLYKAVTLQGSATVNRGENGVPAGTALLQHLEKLEGRGCSVISHIEILESGAPGTGAGHHSMTGGGSVVGLTQRVVNLERCFTGPGRDAGVPSKELPSLFSRHTLQEAGGSGGGRP
jgi:hypothetical protein